MPILEPGLVVLFLVTVALLVISIRNPAFVRTPHGKALAFLGFFVLPIAITALGATEHLRQATSTEFCVSCHVMEPYGESLLFDDPSYLPAVHFQNNLTPRENACYACHANYTMFGDLEAKLAGLQHVYVYYLGEVPEKIELYEPYQNRECLSCHATARTYLENDLHVDILEDLATNTTSCLECHDLVHGSEATEEAHWSIQDPLVQALEGKENE